MRNPLMLCHFGLDALTLAMIPVTESCDAITKTQLFGY